MESGKGNLSSMISLYRMRSLGLLDRVSNMAAQLSHVKAFNIPLYTDYREIACSVCLQPQSLGSVYYRVGRTSCPTGSTALYTGNWVGTNYASSGGSAAQVCLHPEEEPPEVYSNTSTAAAHTVRGVDAG